MSRPTSGYLPQKQMRIGYGGREMVEDDLERQRTWREFSGLVNMTAAEIRRRLDDDESTSVGQGSNAVASGRHVVKILETRKADLTTEDYAHMRTVVAYVKRHRGQWPSGEVDDSARRTALMDWGHDASRANS